MNWVPEYAKKNLNEQNLETETNSWVKIFKFSNKYLIYEKKNWAIFQC